MTGAEERYQIVKEYQLREKDGTRRTASGFVARFSHDRKENKRLIREAAEKYLERKGNNGDGVVLRLDAGLDYNSEMVL